MTEAIKFTLLVLVLWLSGVTILAIKMDEAQRAKCTARGGWYVHSEMCITPEQLRPEFRP